MTDVECYTTLHAEKRLRERAGAKKKSVNKMANNALTRGLSHGELTGKLRRYLDKQYLKYKKGNNIRIYSQKVFIFCGSTLITIYSLPKGLEKLVLKLNQKRNKLEKENELKKRTHGDEKESSKKSSRVC